MNTRDFDEEAARLETDYTNGVMSLLEYNKAMAQLERDYRAEAQEAAEETYRETLNNY
jgi:hypothetical protein